MFQTIIAGCNGTTSGRDALALASALGRLTQADVLAVGVYPDPLMPFPIVLSRPATMREDCQRILRTDRDRLAPKARIHAISAVSPARALRQAVVKERADLLVLGSAEGTEPGLVRVGRHARQLLHDVPCAVAVAPAGFAARPSEPSRILVGFDGSPEASDALGVGQALRTAARGHLRVITAVDAALPANAGWFDAMAYLPADWDVIVDLRRQHARELLDAAITPNEHIETEIVEGASGEVLCDASRSSDLIVIGSRHWGPLSRLVLGSTGEHVVHHAHCPVLVVPRRATETGQPTDTKAMAVAP